MSYDDKASGEMKASIEHLEKGHGNGAIIDPEQDGTVQLVGGNKATTLIPAPSADPHDPLNYPTWLKWTSMIILSFYSCVGLTAVSGLGGVIPYFLGPYVQEGRTYNDIVRLITMPTLTMGLANFLFVPIALAVGRRPVYMFSAALLIVGSILAACNTGYEFHLGARLVLGFAAGQSEALVPLMIKEMFFITDRATVLAFQSTFNGVCGAVLSIFASNIAAGIGYKGWYWMYAGLACLHFVLAYFFVFETKYERPASAYAGFTESADVNSTGHEIAGTLCTQENRPALDTQRYGRRTVWTMARFFTTKMDWTEASLCLKHMGQLILFPNVLLVVLLNSLFLAINIGMGTTYAPILEAAPYSWNPKWLSMASAGQIVVGFIVLPLLGTFSDKIIKFCARRNNGIHEPETRLIPLIFPIVIGITATVMYGYQHDNPFKMHWFGIVFEYSAQYFAFIAASVAGQTYLLDAYPERAGSVLVLVCALRGVISFGVNYGLVPFFDAVGYTTAFGIFAAISAFFSLLLIPIYVFGKRLRLYTAHWATDGPDAKKPSYG